VKKRIAGLAVIVGVGGVLVFNGRNTGPPAPRPPFPDIVTAQDIYLNGDPNDLLAYDGLTPEFLRWVAIHKGVIDPTRSSAVAMASFDGPDYTDADFNDDGRVDVSDHILVITNWGSGCRPMDLNCDGTVGVHELTAVITQWSQ
jgi:hypothetical protein